MVIVKKFKNLYCYLLQYALASLLTWVEFYKIGSNLKKFASLSFISYSIHSRFFFFFFFFSSVQLLSCVQLFATAWTTACQAPCPSPIIGVYSNSCPLSRWFHPTILSSVVPFFSHLESSPASVSFHTSQLFTSGGQNIGVSASTLCHIKILNNRIFNHAKSML